MKRVQLNAYAKINLSLDVLGLLDNGFHEVEMVMQQILLSDDVLIRWKPGAGAGSDNRSRANTGADAHAQTNAGIPTHAPANAEFPSVTITLSTNKYFLPTDERNLAYKAAALMICKYAEGRSGSIRIDIKKRIPVAAGLAGGSSNAAAVIHGIRKLWNLDISLAEMCETGAQLGSDVPFCIMGQAAADKTLRPDFKDDPLACHCALATGTGTELRPLKGLRSHLVLSKPDLSVSTAKVYRGIDSVEIPVHPDNNELIRGLKTGSLDLVRKNMINVLENFTLKHYPIVMYTKNKMKELCSPENVLMSGSGPTVFGLCRNADQAKQICQKMLRENKASFWTRTTR